MTEQISDVFISYAHADDEAPFGETFGWVTIFVDELKRNLRSNSGIIADVWMDYQLAANDKVTDKLVNTVRNSRTLVLFMSKGYSRSEWCQKELGTFLDYNKAHKHKENVFIVELAPTPRENWHPRLQELTPIRFWELDQHQVPQRLGAPVPNTKGDKDYWQNMNRLAHLISDHLETYSEIHTPKIDQLITTEAYKTSPHESQTRSPATDSKSTVWIAEPTDDVIDQWESLAEAIRQAGHEVKPIGLNTYPRSSELDFLNSIRNDMASSQLFVQLLGQFAGSKSKESGTTFLALQASIANELALQQKGGFLQWRNRELKLDNVADETHRQLLTGAIACGFEEFRQRVLTTLQDMNRASTAKIQAKSPDCPLSICINADKSDQDLAHRVQKILVDLDADAFIAPSKAPGQLASDFYPQLEEVIRGSEGVIFIYGQSVPAWVVSQFQMAKKAFLTQQRRGIWGALLDGPPHNPDKSEAGIASKNLMMLNCRDGEERQLIEQFVNALREACHA